MTEEEKHLKFDLFANLIDNTIQHCSSREEILLLASIMMTTTHKLYCVALSNEENADALMLDYVLTKMREFANIKPEGVSLH